MDSAQLLEALSTIAANPPLDVAIREQLYDAARNLMFQVENSNQLTNRVVGAQSILAVAQIALDLDLYRILASQQGEGCTVSFLAQRTNAEKRLLTRILRGLASYGLIDQRSGDTYVANAATQVFTAERTSDAINHHTLNVGPCLQALPEYLRKNGYRNPIDSTNTAWNQAFDTTLPAFVWLAGHPAQMQAAIGNMSGQRYGQKIWMADDILFPLQDFELSNKDVASGRAMLVDVGGGAGQQAVALRSAKPQLRGRVVLQDLQSTLNMIEDGRRQLLEDNDIEVQGHDFFTPQPERGAKVYHLRYILHDWPDDKCLEILTHLREAMSADSVLIIDEMVVEEDRPSWKQFNLDLVVLAALAGEERTKNHFNSLLSSAGFRLREVRTYDTGSGDSIMLCTPI